jgi:hypothetical protein
VCVFSQPLLWGCSTSTASACDALKDASHVARSWSTYEAEEATVSGSTACGATSVSTEVSEYGAQV